MIEETREYLSLLGISQQLLRVKWLSASGGREFAEEIREFDRLLEGLGEDSIAVSKKRESSDTEDISPEDQGPRLTEEQIEYCMECSSCVGSCPVSRENPVFSPKTLIKQVSLGLKKNIISSREIWSCLGCGQCKTRCPAVIDIPEINRSFRLEARRAGYLPVESHHGILQAITSLQALPLNQKRTSWAEKTGKFSKTGKYYYFAGCLPFMDITFHYLGLSPLDTARSALILLNRLGIEPVISNNERCCGHDALCSGDEDTFRKLASLNLENIKATGAETVLFSCPEGYAAFKSFYPRYFGKLPFKVMPLTEFLARKLPGSDLKFHPSSGEKVTFQDPCRLGRWNGIYDQPRQLLNRIPELELVEMERTRENALCCGTSAWMECSRCSKSLQVERLLEARQTGARTLITACPKCLIHLTCALSSEAMDIEIKDIFTYLVEKLE